MGGTTRVGAEMATGRGREWDVGPRRTMNPEEREKEEKTKIRPYEGPDAGTRTSGEQEKGKEMKEGQSVRPLTSTA